MYVISGPNKFDVNMKLFFESTLLIILSSQIPGFVSNSLDNTDENLCFHFSWVGVTNRDEKVNCSSHEFKTIPCIEPVIEDPTPPNLMDLWMDKKRPNFTCYLRPGYSCISHKYEFNGALVNTSYFCGKMLQDASTVVETHCYSQEVGGHTVTACACKSSSSEVQFPCNLSRRNDGCSQIILLGFALYLLLVNKLVELFV